MSTCKSKYCGYQELRDCRKWTSRYGGQESSNGPDTNPTTQLSAFEISPENPHQSSCKRTVAQGMEAGPKDRQSAVSHHKNKRKECKSGPKLYNETLNGNAVAIMVQLRTDHCGLNHYFHRFGIKESSYCKCEYGKETVEHYLLECRNYKEQRIKLWKEMSIGKMKVGILLRDSTRIKHTMAFV